MPHKGYKAFVEAEVGADNHHNLTALKNWKKNLQEMGIIEKISMVQDDVEASIFKSNFQNVNF